MYRTQYTKQTSKEISSSSVVATPGGVNAPSPPDAGWARYRGRVALTLNASKCGGGGRGRHMRLSNKEKGFDKRRAILTVDHFTNSREGRASPETVGFATRWDGKGLQESNSEFHPPTPLLLPSLPDGSVFLAIFKRSTLGACRQKQSALDARPG